MSLTEIQNKTVAVFRGLDVIVMSNKPLPEQPAMASACRNDVVLRCSNPFVVADRNGYTDKRGMHPGLCCPLTNLQRFLAANEQ